TTSLVAVRLEEPRDLVLSKARPEVRAVHAVGLRLRDAARLIEIPVPQRERDTDRPARVAGGRLNPDPIERPFAQDASVADAIERHAAGQAQIAEAGLAMRERGHLQHRLFGDVL